MTIGTIGRAVGDWTPVTATAHDDLVAAPLRRLAALLDHDPSPWRAGELPPLAHWLYFLPEDRQSDLDADGHPRRGALLPPIGAPRRMWAGGRIAFHAPLLVGATATRRSVVTNVERKEGRTGRLSFVTLCHEVLVDGVAAVTEEQDLVYRDALGGSAPPGDPDIRASDATRELTADSRALFRFSALTFNAHRIHYDRDYAMVEEGYPGLVVHGPYQATLLVDHLLRHRLDARLTHFAFRGARPLYTDRPFSLHLAGRGHEVDLWTRDADGQVCMTATATLA